MVSPHSTPRPPGPPGGPRVRCVNTTPSDPHHIPLMLVSTNLPPVPHVRCVCTIEQPTRSDPGGPLERGDGGLGRPTYRMYRQNRLISRLLSKRPIPCRQLATRLPHHLAQSVRGNHKVFSKYPYESYIYHSLPFIPLYIINNKKRGDIAGGVEVVEKGKG